MLLRELAITLLLHGLLFINQTYATDMLPEVKRLLVIPPTNQQDLENNSYVDFMTISAPATVDYIAVGKEIILKNNGLIREAIAKQDNKGLETLAQIADYYNVKDSIDSYQFPCSQLDNQQCVDQVINDRQQAERLLLKHKLLLTRYQIALKKPTYSSYTFVAEAPIPPFHYLVYASQLRLAQAILLIDQGDVQQGLDILDADIKFYKDKLLVNGTLIDSMIAIRQLLVSGFVISGLLDKPQLKPYLFSQKLVSLVNPLSIKEQQSLVSVFKKEQVFVAISGYLIGNNYEQELLELQDPFGIFNEEKRYIQQAKALGYPLTLDKIATMNENYKKMERLIKKAGYTTPIASLQYFFDMADNKAPLSFHEIYLKYGKQNLWGGIFLETDNLSHYLLRLYDLNSYRLLLQTKLRIKQAGISKNQVCGFLVHLKINNPYTGKPFTWNAKKQTLATSWVGEVGYLSNGYEPQLHVQF